MSTYRVDGMTCGGCAKSVTNAIKSLAPDAEVSVNLEAKTVTVTGLNDMAKVEEAVDNAGFEFRGAA